MIALSLTTRSARGVDVMRRIGFLFLITLLSEGAHAQSTTLLAGMFHDHAVLQRDRPIAIWGQASARETVTVSLAASSARAQADATGHWQVTLSAMPAGGPYVLTARGSSGASDSAHDVLLGDVYLCSGQSNMELPVLRAGDSQNEIANAAHEKIRMLTVEHAASPRPLTSFHDPLAWQLAAPDTVPNWSAVCYFFARELQRTIEVPIGLIHASWGGSNIRPWISAAGLRASGDYGPALDTLSLYDKDAAAGQARFAAQWESWWRSKTGERAGEEPWQSTPPSMASDWRAAPAGLGDWRTWNVPELKEFTGLVWFRTTVTLSAAQADSAATLVLGKINQVDETWINGRAVGNTFGYDAERSYALAKGSLRAGDNLIVVNALSTYGNGGLLAGPTRRALHLGTGESIALDDWQYRIVPRTVGWPPRAPWESVGGMTTLYNAMIAPLGRIGLKGVLWYQGESNTEEADSYERLLTGLMADWRGRFGADLSYLIVQLPNYGAPPSVPTESGWAAIREAQRKAVASDAHAGLAVTIDIGEARNLHPTNKQDVGRRLARAAHHVIYGEPIVPSGPVPRGTKRRDDEVQVEFGDVERGLIAYSHDTPIGFELCADAPGSCRFVTSRIEDASVVLETPKGLSPTRVRYCWADSPVCTLFDRSGLPAGPFELRIASSGGPASDAGEVAAVARPVELTSEQDHQRTLELLHIGQLRQGPDGDPASPRAANFDESKVAPYAALPDPLRLKNGERVTSTKSWWQRRRPQIVADFDKEIYGRVPASAPKIAWQVVRTTRESNDGIPVVTKQLVGHADNSSYPLLSVDIDLTLTTPANAAGSMPVIMEYGLSAEALAALQRRLTPAQRASLAGSGPSWQRQVLERGWGYATLVPTSIQADNGAGLTRGVIGLANKGQPRKLDDWGALRAWAWGASRALDYFETDSAVDAKQVAIEGLSRYGKAALVAMAYEPRLAIALVGSSGEGGAKILRRNFGEQVENVASTSEYHWMAGNFLKYAGPLTANDLPVDAHELIALCAPRPVFVSSGSQQVEGGWVDARGMFLAAVAAGPVYELLGKQGLGTSEFPAMETALTSGDIAFRQHTDGHTVGPNWPAFLEFASRYLKAPTP